MKCMDFLKKTNTVLVFILLIAAIALVGYMIVRLRMPVNMVHVSVDSLHVGKK